MAHKLSGTLNSLSMDRAQIYRRKQFHISNAYLRYLYNTLLETSKKHFIVKRMYPNKKEAAIILFVSSSSRSLSINSFHAYSIDTAVLHILTT